VYGKDFQYASTRIENTIVRLTENNEPVYVYSVDINGGMCEVVPLSKLDNPERNFRNTGSILVALDDLNVRPVRLGYVNFNAQAFYLERMPIRHGPGNQGLNGENCESSGPRLFNFPMQELIKCIKGVYPSFNNAVDKTRTNKRNGQQKTIAFNRYWAVGHGKVLMYKNHEVVGEIKGGAPILDKNYLYLKERLEEIL
jgi:hypothetical protein